MQASQSLIAELESSFSKSPSFRRLDVLRRVTDLFLNDAVSLSDEHVVIFDDVMSYLIEKIETQALIELSHSLAPVDNAPAKVIGRLSRDDDIRVSGPVLEKSKVLSDADLVEISRTKSQDHLSAIASRGQISEPVTDVLVDRGNAHVTHKVAVNHGARFSKLGFGKVVDRAERDEDLAEAVTKRPDLPPELFERLVRRATEIVRRRLLANAEPEMRERITEVLAVVSRQVARTELDRLRNGGAGNLKPRNPERLRAQISTYANARQTAELVNALAMFCQVPVKAINNLVRRGADEGLLVLGKANYMGWPELLEILKATMPAKIETPDDERELFEKFIVLSTANAQRAIRFIKMNNMASKDDIRKWI